MLEERRCSRDVGSGGERRRLGVGDSGWMIGVKGRDEGGWFGCGKAHKGSVRSA